MNNGSLTTNKYEMQENFNYSFDYSDFNTTGGQYKHNPSVFTPALKSIVMVATVLSMLFMIIVILIRRNTRGHQAFRWYSINLMLINFIVLVVIVANDKDLSFLVKPMVSSSTYNRLKSYNFDLVELSNIVYVSTTTFLIVDATYRYRRNGVGGFTSNQWLVITVLDDVIPLLYVVIQHEFFPYSTPKPKPYALYHALWWAVFGVASSSFIMASICCIKARKQETYMEKVEYTNVPKASTFSKEYESSFVKNKDPTFNHRHLIRLALYLIFTLWIQWPTAYNVGPDLITVSPSDMDNAMKLMPKVQPFIKTLLNINIWATLCMPLVETLACLVFLPSLGDLFCFKSESNFHQPPRPPTLIQ